MNEYTLKFVKDGWVILSDEKIIFGPSWSISEISNYCHLHHITLKKKYE